MKCEDNIYKSVNFKDNIYRFVNFKDNFCLLFFLVFFTIVEGLVPPISTVLIGRCFKIFTKIYFGEYKTYNQMHHDLVLRAMSLVILAAGYFPISWLSVSLWMKFGEIQNYKIRSTIFQNYLKQNFNFYDTNKDLMPNFVQTNRCIEELRQACSEASGMAFRSIISIIALFAVSCYYSWSLTLIFLCSAPLIIVVSGFSSKKYEKYSQLENDESSACSETLLNVIENITLIKLNASEKSELQKFDEKIKRCNSFYIKGSFWTSFNQAVLRMLSLCMFVQGFWFGSSQIKKGKLSTEKVIICFTSCISLGSTLMSFVHQIIIIQKGKIALRYINKILEKSEIEEDDSNLITLPLPSKLSNNLNNMQIKFNKVTAAYDSRPNINVLNDVSMTINPNEFCFVVGKSGSGKSSLFNLLLKLYDNQYAGTITINDIDIRDIPANWLLSQITLVEQNTHLFNDTLKNNLLLGSKYKDCETSSLFKEVIEITQLQEVVDSLPKGLDTIMGQSILNDEDDGAENKYATLSGGQQQKVAIARALLRNTPIIIFDEALSAIDVKSSSLILKNLKQHCKEKTVVMLSHNLTCIEDDDLVYVMEDSKLKEAGRKTTLLENDGSFKQQYDLQMFYQQERKNNDTQFLRQSKIIKEEYSDVNSFGSKELVLSPTNSKASDILSSVKLISEIFVNDVKEEDTETEYDEVTEESMLYEQYNSPKRLPLTSFKKIFQNMYKTITNKFLLFLGLLAAVVSGISNPVFSWADAKLINANVLQGKNHLSANITTNTTLSAVKYYRNDTFSEFKIHSANKNLVSSSPDDAYMVKWCVIVIAIAVVDGIATFLKNFLLQYVAEFWIMNLRYTSFKTILTNQLCWFSFALNKPSELSALLMNDLRDMRTLVSQFLSVMLTIIAVSLCGLIWAMLSGWKLSLVGLSMIPLYILCTIGYTILLQNIENQYKSSIANLENKQYEMLKNFKTMKILQVEGSLNIQLAECYNKIKTVGIKRSLNTGVGVAMFSSLTYIIQAIVIFYGIELVIKGEYSSSRLFTTFSLLLFTIISCAMLSSSVPEFARGQRGATYIFQVINNKIPEFAPIEPYAYSQNVPICENIISFKDVDFTYPNTGVQTLKQLSFEIKKDETIGLVGPSGCGKSTVAKLLAKLYDSGNGFVKVNNVNIDNWDLAVLREFMVFFEQKNLIFRGTLRENLEYGNDATDKEILELLSYFELDTLLAHLNGLDDGFIDVGLVSGGQLQRLNFVRQLLRLKSLKEKCQVAVFDEITASLDPHTSVLVENYIMQNINKTKLLITHHKSLMMKCDRLVVFNQFGEVKEIGHFEELMKKENSYLKNLLGEFN